MPEKDFPKLEDLELVSVLLTGGAESCYAWLERALRLQRGKRILAQVAVLQEIK